MSRPLSHRPGHLLRLPPAQSKSRLSAVGPFLTSSIFLPGPCLTSPFPPLKPQCKPVEQCPPLCPPARHIYASGSSTGVLYEATSLTVLAGRYESVPVVCTPVPPGPSSPSSSRGCSLLGPMCLSRQPGDIPRTSLVLSWGHHS